MAEDNNRPGVKTTEFWMLAAIQPGQALALIQALNIQETWAKVVIILALITQGVLYQVFREKKKNGSSPISAAVTSEEKKDA